MWLKTIFGLLFSLFLMTTLVMNVIALLPIPRDVYFLFAFVGGILIWGGLMTYFYCATKFGRAILVCLPIFFVSAAINAAFYMELI